MNRNLIKLKTHCKAYRLELSDPVYRSQISTFFSEEFKKDLGKKGDITTSMLFSDNKKISANIMAKESGTIAGLQEVAYFLNVILGLPKGKLKLFKKDGSCVKFGEKILGLSGGVKNIFAVERIILNFLGRLSGIATFAKKLVKIASSANPDILLTPTRKTLWGLFDKKACVIGGAGTHRLTLDDAILIKSNHIKAFGGNISDLLERIFKKVDKKVSFIEIEVNTVKQALEAAKSFCHCELYRGGIRQNNPPLYIMFDNMSVKEISRALHGIKKADFYKKILFEASGGINEKNLKAYAKTGVDIISLGCLTTKAKTLDMSLINTAK